ncbi:type II secretion system F family protein [Actinacidiphila acidipaludis]|uniref:Type II secretion system F family protein n=1 Tax=Actinacidiphila acidipaludis TaxID=2873382 RepID=A0ABS7QE01_9ACTN|nr:type II secretion system F family protein [Streptomyces acidipaludis]MBY8881396.1 type II secretion system F family protein [Streptomyces acidipaludis]
MSADTVHSLGMAVGIVAAGIAFLLTLAEARERGGGVGRLRRALGRAPSGAARLYRTAPGHGPPRSGDQRARERVPERLRVGAACLAAGVVVGLLLGGVLGVLAGALVAVGAARWWTTRRVRLAAETEAGGELDPAELPLCADLMAACLAAGASPGEAAGAVGTCLGGPLGAALIRAQAELRLGAEPEDCWDRLGRLPQAREMARCLARASTTGSAPVAEMTRLAADCRAAHARSALARARKAAVMATAPLGVCFLPAFLLVGVAPVVMGLAGAVLGGAMT